MPEKKRVREMIRARRSSLAAEDKNKMDKMIMERLIGTDIFRAATKVFTFVSFRNEVDTKWLIGHSLSMGKRVFVPLTMKEHRCLEIREITGMNDLQPGYMGIHEPTESCPIFPLDELNLIIVPGLAFDSKGRRLGYGGGYYDSVLSDLPDSIIKIAPIYSFQLLERIPLDPWDERVDYVVTENEIIDCR